MAEFLCFVTGLACCMDDVFPLSFSPKAILKIYRRLGG